MNATIDTSGSWLECIIGAEGIRSGELYKFRNLCAQAFQPAKFPKEAAVFSEAVFGNDQLKFWVSPLAARLLIKKGITLEQWQARESAPPLRADVALLAGHQERAWELLPP